MSDKRPTREEAIRASAEAWCSGPAINEQKMDRAIDAVAALFGGFEPSPVEVPRVGVHGESGGRNKAWVDSSPLESAPLTREQAAVVAARSNVWGELKALTEDALYSQTPEITLGLLTAIKNVLNRPEMGVGPKVQP
jgi:hypothetical protein